MNRQTDYEALVRGVTRRRRVMNRRAAVFVAMLVFAGLVLWAGAAGACTDAYAWPPNASCSPDEAGAWIYCSTHNDCPKSQRCYDGVCTFLTACPYAEPCTDAGCSCELVPSNLAPNCGWDAGYCGRKRGDLVTVTCKSPSDGGDDGGCSTGGFALGGVGPAVLLVLALAWVFRRRRA